MQELELKQLWQLSNERLEKSLKINQEQSKDVQQLKIQNYLSSMKPVKIFTVLIAIIWVGIGVPLLSQIFMNAFEQANKFFLFSATIQVLITAIALGVYIYQLITIYSIDVTETVLKTQKELATLKSSTLWITRILFLQLPVWTTFYWNASILENGNWFLWIFQAIVTLLFTYTAIWLFLNIKIENKDKKWFQLIFKGKEWTPLMKSMELLDKIKEFKTEE
jgi:F0F1-type ATP synthase assembly protein I